MTDPAGGFDDEDEAVAEVVPPLLAGERLDRVVSMVTDASRAVVAAWLADGRVTVDGATVTKASLRLREGQLVVAPPRPPDAPARPVVADATVAVTVVHADDEVIVVEKQPGLVVHPAPGNWEGTLVHGLLARFPEIASVGVDPTRPGIVHRIDKDTSGLLVVARTQDAYHDLVGQLQAHTVERAYLALLWGHLQTRAGQVDGPIGRSRRDPTRRAVSATGKEARTDFEVITAFDAPVAVSLVRCRLHTGRTHQIRVHMQSIGHPVVGDTVYGGARQSLVVPRLFLHAATLGFTHPGTGELLRFESELPDDLGPVLARLS